MKLSNAAKWRGFFVGAVIVVVGFWLRGPVESQPALPGGKPFRVEVLNGSGVHKAGLGLAEALREKGFDVVEIRNADRSDYERTLVLDRVGQIEYAESVAAELGVQPAYLQRNDDLILEVTVILGRDLGPNYGVSQ